MIKLKKGLAAALTLGLCSLLLCAPLALAETVIEQNTSVEDIENTVNVDTTEDGEPIEDAGDATEIEPDEILDDADEPDEVLDENGEVVPPGTTPDSPFYWLTMLIEDLQVIFTLDPVAKTELLEDQALERMAEAQVLIEEGNNELAESTLNAYSEKVAAAQAFVAQLTDTDSETLQKLETALSTSHAKNIQTLGGILDKLPPQAAQKVALNVVRSMEKSIAKMEKKDQQMIAKGLRKVTENIEDSELSEEDQAALKSIEEASVPDSQDGELEEPEDATVATVGATLSNMAVSTDVLSDKPVAQKAKATKPKLEAKVELKPTKQQEPKLEPKVEVKNETKNQPKDELKAEAKDKPIDEAKPQEQKQQEDKPKAEQERALKKKVPSTDSPASKQEREKTQPKAQKAKAE